MQRIVTILDTALTVNYNDRPISTQKDLDTYKFQFDDSWLGYVKTAVFYTDPMMVRHVVLLEDNIATIPWEVLVGKPQVLYIGVFGTKDTKVKPTTFGAVRLREGSYIDGIAPLPPTPDVYQQIISAWEGAKTDEAERVANENSRKNNFDALVVEYNALKAELEQQITDGTASVDALQVLEADYASKALALETTYAPRLGSVESQLAEKASKAEVTNVMTPKGTLAYASLPTTGNTVGWYYYCSDGDGTHGKGNYVWDGTVWYFGGTGDGGYNFLKEDLIDIGNGVQTLTDNWQLGNLGSFGEFNVSNNRIVSTSYIQYSRDIIIQKPTSTDILNICTYDSSHNFIAKILSLSNGYTIVANTIFKAVITTSPEVNVTSINDYANKIKITTAFEYRVNGLEKIAGGYLTKGTYNSGVVTKTTMIAPYDDLNTLPINTFIAYSTSDVYPVNTPFGGSAIFNIMTYCPFLNGSTPHSITQIASDITGKSYIRSKWGTDWSKWHMITNDTETIEHYSYKTILPTKLNIASLSSLIFFGDSIVEGTTSQYGGSLIKTGGYVQNVANHFGCTVINNGVAGSGYYKNESGFPAASILGKMQAVALTGDYLFIAAGTNDFDFGVSKENFKTALTNTFDYVDANYNGQVILILPIDRTYISADALFPLEWYRQTIFEYGIQRGYCIVNGADFGFPDKYNTTAWKDTVIADGVHPTVLGHTMYANALLTQIDR